MPCYKCWKLAYPGFLAIIRYEDSRGDVTEYMRTHVCSQCIINYHGFPIEVPVSATPVKQKFIVVLEPTEAP